MNGSPSHNDALWLDGLQIKRIETRVNRNLKKDVCVNHNYGTELNLINAVRKYLRYIGSWPKL
ncbi:MAG: hypothetical protein WA667_21820 [Candidatus Nitrosopolaris sp.]